MATVPRNPVSEGAPFDLFSAWFEAATASEPNDPNAMTLATCSAAGQPAARMVLLKGLDGAERPDRGFVFYTNTESRKADDLRAHPAVGLLFHWKTQRRQVRIEGMARPVAAAEADAYFASRPRLSRLGAWASDQSRPLDDRHTLEQRLEAAGVRFPHEEIPRPPHWSGYRVVPDAFEFWQDMPFRLHDRTVYTRPAAGGAPDTGWSCGKLYP